MVVKLHPLAPACNSYNCQKEVIMEVCFISNDQGRCLHPINYMFPEINDLEEN
jgi:hypothetical protein